MGRPLSRPAHQLGALAGLSLAGLVLSIVSPVGRAGGAESAAVQLSRTALTAIQTATLLVGPGIALRAWRPRWLSSMTYLALPGLAMLAGIGGLDWALAGRVSERALSALAVGSVLIAILTTAIARPRECDGVLPRGQGRALAVYALLFAVVVAKAMWSLGPVGELYGGTVSRTLEVGDRSDSRISYHVVQLVAHGENPYSAAGAANFLPYTFADRGPLAGLAAAPITLATGAQLPVGLPDQSWVPFDPQGFAAYRIAMEGMLLTLLFAVYGLTRTLLRSETAAVLGVLLAATTPLVVHEAFFTWPKLLAAGLVLTSVQLLLEHRPVRAGLVFAAGYLTHPLVLLAGPSVGLIALMNDARARGQRIVRATTSAGGLAVGAALVIGTWRALNGSHLDQQLSHFLPYLYLVDGHPAATVMQWAHGRLGSLANTFVPLWLTLVHPSEPSINSISGPSPPVIHFYFQYWTTFPFAVGITVLPWLVMAVLRFTRVHPWISAVAVLLPPALFAVYWGASVGGLMREGLQIWAVVLVVVLTWQTWTRSRTRRLSGALRAGLLLRVPDVVLMMLLPTALTRNALLGPGRSLTDGVALLVIVGGMGAIGWMLARELGRLTAAGASDGELSESVATPTSLFSLGRPARSCHSARSADL